MLVFYARSNESTWKVAENDRNDRYGPVKSSLWGPTFARIWDKASRRLLGDFSWGKKSPRNRSIFVFRVLPEASPYGRLKRRFARQDVFGNAGFTWCSANEPTIFSPTVRKILTTNYFFRLDRLRATRRRSGWFLAWWMPFGVLCPN